MHVPEGREGDVTDSGTADLLGKPRCDPRLCERRRREGEHYPEDADVLLEYEPRVMHYEVVGKVLMRHSISNRSMATGCPWIAQLTA